MRVKFISAANFEMAEAINYYNHLLPGLGLRFYQEVSGAIERVLLMPEGWTKIDENTRRCLLKEFPYALYYVYEKDQILITAVAHLHRNPEHYKNRTW